MISAILFCQLHVSCTGITTPTIHQLTEELTGMNDFYLLGVALLVPVSKLQEIMESSPEGGTLWRIVLAGAHEGKKRPTPNRCNRTVFAQCIT